MATENQAGNGGDSPEPPPLDGRRSQEKRSAQEESFAAQAKEDLRQILPHLLLPLCILAF